MAMVATPFRQRKNLASEECVFIYSLRKCKRSLGDIIKMAEDDRSADCLYHLITCDECRMHVQERDPDSSEEQKIEMLWAAINGIERALERKNRIRQLRIQRKMAQARER